MLSQFGVDPRRVRLTWIGASEGNEFAHTVNTLAAEIKELGPIETKTALAL